MKLAPRTSSRILWETKISAGIASIAGESLSESMGDFMELGAQAAAAAGGTHDEDNGLTIIPNSACPICGEPG